MIKILAFCSLVAQRLKHLPAMRETWVRSLGQEDSPGEGNGNPLQCSCLENPMDRGAWWATVHGVAKSRTRLSDFTSLQSFKVKYRCKKNALNCFRKSSFCTLYWFKSYFCELPRWLNRKNPLANAGDPRDAGSNTVLRRSPSWSNCYPLQYSCLESSSDRGT